MFNVCCIQTMCLGGTLHLARVMSPQHESRVLIFCMPIRLSTSHQLRHLYVMDLVCIFYIFVVLIRTSSVLLFISPSSSYHRRPHETNLRYYNENTDIVTPEMVSEGDSCFMVCCFLPSSKVLLHIPMTR